MAPREVMTESDDQDASGDAVTLGIASDPATRGRPEPELEMVEADATGRPINGRSQPPEAEEEEPNLAEEGGERPLIESQDEADGQGRRSEPKSHRRARQREARDRSHATINLLARRVAELEGQVTGLEPRLSGYDQAQIRQHVGELDRGITDATQRASEARRRMADAMANPDLDERQRAAAFNDALDMRDKAIMDGQQLTVRKNLLTTGDPMGQRREQQPDPRARQPERQPAPAPLPRAAQLLASDFVSRHPWMQDASDPRRFDQQIARELDNAVIAEGYDPSTQDYWDELEDRMREYLPHRFAESRQPSNTARRSNGNGNGAGNGQRQPAPERRGPMIAAPADRGPGLKPNQVLITPDRKKAMMDAGVIDAEGKPVDKHRYNRLLRGYQEHDRAQSVARQ